MKVKINNPFFGMMNIYHAEIIAKSNTSCNVTPFLLVGGMSVTPQEAMLAKYQYLESTDVELTMLNNAGYLIQGGGNEIPF